VYVTYTARAKGYISLCQYNRDKKGTLLRQVSYLISSGYNFCAVMPCNIEQWNKVAIFDEPYQMVDWIVIIKYESVITDEDY